MAIKGEWAGPCPGCGAVGGCCTTSKGRGEMADSLARLVARQSTTITTLQREKEELKQVVADLRKEKAR